MWHFYFDKNEGHKVWKTLQDLPRYKHRSIKYEKIQITDSKYTTNIVISDSIDTNDPWVLVSNKNLNRSVKDYSYRFGGIECLFKNQKSNGFYLEKTVNASLKYFESMYSILCTVSLYLTLLGSDFAKNTKCYKNVKISTHTSSNGKRIRILSLFNTGVNVNMKCYKNFKVKMSQFLKYKWHFLFQIPFDKQKYFNIFYS